MKVHLLYPDRDFDPRAPLPPEAGTVVQDLELPTLLDAMASGDRFLFEVAQKTLLLSLTKVDEIGYRQRVLEDCLRQPATVRQLYDLAVEAVGLERKVWFGVSTSPESILRNATDVLRLYVGALRKLRELGADRGGEFRSEGFRGLFSTLADELGEEYLRKVEAHLDRLEFRDGLRVSAELGRGLKGARYAVRSPVAARKSWLRRLWSQRRTGNSFEVADRDETGHRNLGELRDRGLNPLANVVAKSLDHILDFFAVLRAEVGFYVGALNLMDRLASKGLPTCLPSARPPEETVLAARGLYDVGLALRSNQKIVPNDLSANGKELVVITGANQGGKTTFLRAVGVAHLMMQCGLAVGARSFSAGLPRGVFTHFKRREDATMTRGKLEEELHRMSEIASHLRPHALLLCNESFSSTNEWEGSEIGRQVLRALSDGHVKVVFVTFLQHLADGIYRTAAPNTLFLRAERGADGLRTFHLAEAEPWPTGFGADLYRLVFEAGAEPGAPAPVRP